MSMEIGERPQDAGELLAAVLEEVARSPDGVSGKPSSASA
jgi:hypothetical protein